MEEEEEKEMNEGQSCAITCVWGGREAGRQPGRQAGTQVGRQADRQAGRQASSCELAAFTCARNTRTHQAP
jgi:hypothetical protein